MALMAGTLDFLSGGKISQRMYCTGNISILRDDDGAGYHGADDAANFKHS
jgi:hypothetical protein